jgi:hypothetical protein
MAGRGGKRRDPARERSWRLRIQKQVRSGLSVREFCRREGLKDWTFRWWRQELIRRDKAPALTGRNEPIGAPPVFLPVRVIDPEATAFRSAPPIEILMPTGPTVRVACGFDPGTLRSVLAVLEGCPC